MKIFSLFFLFLMTPLYAADVNWHTPYCQDSCLPQSGAEKLIPQDVLALGSILDQGDKLKTSIETQKKDWSGYIHWLQGSKTQKTLDYPERWSKNEDEARAILEVFRAIGTANRRVDACLANCSASRKLELLDDLEKLQKLKSGLISMSPWWLSEDFDKLANKTLEKSNYTPSSLELKNILLSGMNSFLKEGSKIQAQVTSIQDKIKDHLKGSKSLPSYKLLMGSIVTHESDALDVLLQRGIVSGKTDLCALADEKGRWDLVKKRGKQAIRGGLVVASLLAPESWLIGLASRSSIPIIASAGARTIQMSAIIPDAALIGFLVNERLLISDTCKTKLALTKVGNSEAEWRQCLEEGHKATLAIAFSGLTSYGSILPFTAKIIAKAKQLPFKASEKAITFSKASNGDNISSLNLSEGVALKSKGLDNVSERYWSFVGDVYSRRLNLSPDEIKDFLNSSKLFEKRSHLVLVTKGNPSEAKIEGGVALVTSDKASDKLPLEKALGITLERKGSEKIAEITRLTSESKDNPKLMSDVLKELARITKEDKSLTKIYIYTSKTHEVLYRRARIPYKKIEIPSDRDILGEIDVKEFQKALLK